jgi:sarcosine oxidase subunit gamma
MSPDLARPSGGSQPIARSPIEDSLRRAGARFAVRNGWSVATDFGDPAAEAQARRSSVAVADRSDLGKLEVAAPATELAELIADASGGHRLELGSAVRAGGAWWCPVTPERVLAVCDADSTRDLRERLVAGAGGRGAGVVELTTELAAIGLAGPRSRDVLARLSALDLRPQRAPEPAFRPGSVARVPAMVLREGGDRFLVLFGSAFAQYMWTVVWDAAQPLGGRPMGAAALEVNGHA